MSWLRLGRTYVLLQSESGQLGYSAFVEGQTGGKDRLCDLRCGGL